MQVFTKGVLKMESVIIQIIIWVVLCIAYIISLYATYKLGQKSKSLPPKIGRIVMDHSDPDGPHAFLEVDSGCSKYFEPGNEVLLDIVAKDYLVD